MPRSTDVTDEVIERTSGPGEHVERVKRTKAAKALSPTLQTTLDAWNRRSDKSLGFVSNVLAYGFTGSPLWLKKSEHTSLVKLIKGKHLRVCQIDAKPPAGSNAHRSSPFGDRYYLVRESCPSEVAEGQLHGRRSRK